MGALIKRQEKALDKAVEINESILSICHQANSESTPESHPFRQGNHPVQCNLCGNPKTHPCHQDKPEVSPEKEEKCLCGGEGSRTRVKEPALHSSSLCETIPPAKEEKEVCTCSNTDCLSKHTPTPTDQKGEWEEEFSFKFFEYHRSITSKPTLVVKKGVRLIAILDFIAAKKKEWEAEAFERGVLSICIGNKEENKKLFTLKEIKSSIIKRIKDETLKKIRVRTFQDNEVASRAVQDIVISFLSLLDNLLEAEL